jgi:hypothetical protein
MRPRRDVMPYMGSSDISINASLSIGKIWKRCRLLGLKIKHGSRYQSRLKSKQAAKRVHLRAGM